VILGRASAKQDYDIVFGDTDFADDAQCAHAIVSDEVDDNCDDISVVDSDDGEEDVNEAQLLLSEILGADEEDEEESGGFNLEDFKDLVDIEKTVMVDGASTETKVSV
jgi:hypothetical protein